MAVDPLGGILAEGNDGPCRVVAEFDMAGADANHVVVDPDVYEFDYEADRRPAAYGPITGQTPLGTATGSAGAGSAEAAGPAAT